MSTVRTLIGDTTLTLERCDTCAALVLPADKMDHEIWHESLATVVELLQDRIGER